MEHIKESDWKKIKALKELALQCYCERVLAEVQKTIDDSDKSWHKRYLSVYETMQERDETLARIFNDLRRSNADICLFLMIRYDLVSDEELVGFSDDLAKIVDERITARRERRD